MEFVGLPLRAARIRRTTIVVFAICALSLRETILDSKENVLGSEYVSPIVYMHRASKELRQHSIDCCGIAIRSIEELKGEGISCRSQLLVVRWIAREPAKLFRIAFAVVCLGLRDCRPQHIERIRNPAGNYWKPADGSLCADLRHSFRKSARSRYDNRVARGIDSEQFLSLEVAMYVDSVFQLVLADHIAQRTKCRPVAAHMKDDGNGAFVRQDIRYADEIEGSLVDLNTAHKCYVKRSALVPRRHEKSVSIELASILIERDPLTRLRKDLPLALGGYPYGAGGDPSKKLCIEPPNNSA
jgi:hypothetical protein